MSEKTASSCISRLESDALKCLAAVLIFNSHCDLFYPWPFIATGGAIGNALFFSLWGFGTYKSQTQKYLPFGSWVLRRLSRIAPAMWATLLLIEIPTRIWESGDFYGHFLDYVSLFYWPPYWFLQAICLYIVPLYFVIRAKTYRALFWGIFVNAILYSVCYINYLDLSRFQIEQLPFKLLFYYIAVLLGVWWGMNGSRIRFRGISDHLGLLVSLVCFYTHKLVMAKIGSEQSQFLQHVLLLVLLIFIVRSIKAPCISVKLLMLPRLRTAIQWTGNMSLEFYIVQISLQPVIANLSLPFPIGLVVYLCSTVLGAVLVRQTAEVMRSAIRSKNDMRVRIEKTVG